MKTMLFLLCAGFCTTCFGQALQPPGVMLNSGRMGDSIRLGKDALYKSKPDTGIDKYVLPYNGMPNTFLRKNPPDIYAGNNGRGQDIYRAQLDNMPILKPDSTFQAGGMPNAIKRYDLKSLTVPADPTIPPGAWRGQPKPGIKTPNK